MEKRNTIATKGKKLKLQLQKNQRIIESSPRLSAIGFLQTGLVGL